MHRLSVHSDQQTAFHLMHSEKHDDRFLSFVVKQQGG